MLASDMNLTMAQAKSITPFRSPYFLASIRPDLPRNEYDTHCITRPCSAKLPAYDSMRDDEMTNKKKRPEKSTVSLI
jgi:hypothetical protein